MTKEQPQTTETGTGNAQPDSPLIVPEQPKIIIPPPHVAAVEMLELAQMFLADEMNHTEFRNATHDIFDKGRGTIYVPGTPAFLQWVATETGNILVNNDIFVIDSMKELTRRIAISVHRELWDNGEA